MRHKHADLIIAWADGAEIECYVEDLDIWISTEEPSWNLELKYRIKLKPKPDVVRYWVIDFLKTSAEPMEACSKHQMKIIFSGDGNFKSAEVIK